MHWIELSSDLQLFEIKERSKEKPQLIFKHSTRCATSTLVKNRLERHTDPKFLDFYFLDLIKNRNISNKIAEEFAVYHESPQVLLIINNECVYDESHLGISMEDVLEQVSAHQQ